MRGTTGILSNHIIRYKGRTIAFSLERKNVRNINLRVKSDSTVIVSANRAVDYKHVEQFVLAKAPWVIKNLERFDKRQKVESSFQFITGEIMVYLGRQYELLVVRCEKNEEVFIDHDKLFIFVSDENDYNRKEKLINCWLRDEAFRLFKCSMERIYPLVAAQGIAKPSITVRSMKTRWGSCSVNRQKITLNSELVKTPEECIDYVVLHELAHFRHRKHDKMFYSFISELMPDWKERRKVLKNCLI